MSSPVDRPAATPQLVALGALDAAAIRRWADVAVELLEAHRSEIDGLNVFPVADRDTGTNLALTLRAAQEALEADPGADTAAAALRALAVGAALGAQGNSGAIVSQVLRGLAESGLDDAPYDGVVLTSGLLRGATLARSAVVDPVEGTILTVAAAAANSAALGGTLAEVVTAAVQAAVDALSHTPEQLALLAESGVVDAGGRGLVLLLDALAQVVTGAPIAEAVRPPATLATALAEPCESPGSEFGYEVQYLLDASEDGIAALRTSLAALGDSVVIAGTGGGTWNVHVHVNDVGAAIEAGIDVGRPRRVRVVSFAEQIAATPPRSALVAIAPAAGLAHLFAGEGVHIVATGADANAIAAAITESAAAQVVLLPNAADTTGAAESAAALARRGGVRVVVIPTKSPVQGLAAVAVHDASRSFDEDVVAMAEAAAATRHAEVAIADDDALTSVGMCHAGDILGLIDGDVVQVGHSKVSVALALLDRLLGVGAELMTVLVGEGMPDNTAALLTEHVRERAPLTEVSVYASGDAERPLIIGAE